MRNLMWHSMSLSGSKFISQDQEGRTRWNRDMIGTERPHIIFCEKRNLGFTQNRNEIVLPRYFVTLPAAACNGTANVECYALPRN
jgi:hypothetical protein